ncbi:MAG: ABC transporter ATP-binding protein [Burkholderiales bacterium]|nr:ABC transporter ATP-binding protein [Burkholderiales bacterium]
MAALLRVAGLSKAFGALQVTQDVSFEVQAGEILGVIGPNGAGKTTLFGLLAGNIPPSAGRVEFAGEDITAAPAHERARLGLARTFQVPRPFGHMTVFENLKTAARFGGNLSDEEADAWVERVLAMTGMQSTADQLAGRLPLLMRKRHELARALAMKPKLMLVDEVAAGLTDQEVNQFIQLVQSIRKSGVTIIWIEHVMKTMLSATDRLLALHSGRLLAIGKPQDVFNHPDVRRVYLGA